MLIKANWGDLGYSRIGPMDPDNTDEWHSAEQLSMSLADRVGFERQKNSNGWWIRDRARVKGQKRPDALIIHSVIDSENYSDLRNYKFLEAVKAGPYGNFQYNLPPQYRHERVAKFSDGPGSPKGIYALMLAFGGCPITELPDFLSKVLLPAFFHRYGKGRVIFLRPNYSFESRHAGMRAGYTASQYGRIDSLNLEEKTFEAMVRWQPLMPSLQARLFLDLVTILFFPRLSYFTGYRPGLLLIFVPSELFVDDKHEFPASWRELFSAYWDFAKGEKHPAYFSLFNETKREKDTLKVVHGRAINDASDIEDFLRWIIERYNRLAFHQTHPAEFIDNNLVDFVSSFEHVLSFDRILRKGMCCAVSAESVSRKEATMEIADIMGELAVYWGAAKMSAEHFKKLVHPVGGRSLIKTAFNSAPERFRGIIMSITDDIYDNIQETIVNSVYVNKKKTSSGILVLDNRLSAEQVESHPEFTANVIRALRNTNHGYLSKNDRGLRPSRYLALVDGNVPEAFARLGTLLALAAVVDPQTMFGWRFLPTGTMD